MFTFFRTRTSPVEVFEILVQTAALPEPGRFGPPARYDAFSTESLLHQVGRLVAIPDGDSVEVHLMCKEGLVPHESAVLWSQIYLLFGGRNVHQIDSQRTPGWFQKDVLLPSR